MWRVHKHPTALPPVREEVGPNRYDDPRPHAVDRYVVRYLASTLPGALLESLAWLRPDHRAIELLDSVEDPDDSGSPQPSLAAAVAQFLRTRRVASAKVQINAFVDLHAPATLAALDLDQNVQPILDSPSGRDALGNRHSSQRPHLDQAAILLASDLGRAITQHCSLAIWDQRPDYAGAAYRSRHDLTEWCWAVFDFVPVAFSEPVPLNQDNPAHRDAVIAVANLWDLPVDDWIAVR